MPTGNIRGGDVLRFVRMVSTCSTLVPTARPDCRKGSLATGQGTRYVFTPSLITVRQTILGHDFYMAVAFNVGRNVDIFERGHCGPTARVAEWLAVQVTMPLFLRRIVPFYDRAANAWTGSGVGRETPSLHGVVDKGHCRMDDFAVELVSRTSR